MLFDLLMWALPFLIGAGFYWVSNKSRGKNARAAFRCWAWAAWLLPITTLVLSLFLPPLLGWLILIVRWVPSAIAIWLGMRSMLKEMRAQKMSDYTEAA